MNGLYALNAFVAMYLIVPAVAKLLAPTSAATGLTLLTRGRYQFAVQRTLAVAEMALAAVLLSGYVESVAWAAAAALSGAGVAYLTWLGLRHPLVPCGCSGRVASAPSTSPKLVEAAGLTVVGGAMATLVGLGWHYPPSWLPAAVGVALALSWHRRVLFGLVTDWRGTGDVDCATKRGESLTTTLERVLSSRAWRNVQSHQPDPNAHEAWREGCWRFFAFAADGGTVVAALSLQRGSQPIVTYVSNTALSHNLPQLASA